MRRCGFSRTRPPSPPNGPPSRTSVAAWVNPAWAVGPPKPSSRLRRPDDGPPAGLDHGGAVGGRPEPLAACPDARNPPGGGRGGIALASGSPDDLCDLARPARPDAVALWPAWPARADQPFARWRNRRRPHPALRLRAGAWLVQSGRRAGISRVDPDPRRRTERGDRTRRPPRSARGGQAGHRGAGASERGRRGARRVGRLVGVAAPVLGRVQDTQAVRPLCGPLRGGHPHRPRRRPRPAGGRAQGHRVGAPVRDVAGRRGGRALSYAVYSALLYVLLLAYLPIFALKRLRPDGYGPSLRQRLGRLGEGLPHEPRCWIHAVSVGEAATAVPLVEAINRRWPQLGIVMTTVTPTGARIVADRLAGRVVHRYFPIDLPGPVRRALDAIHPSFFIAMETELWPNLLRALARRGVPSMIATARMLAHVRVLAMQSEEDARRIIALGALPERVVVTGNIKSDLIPPEGDGDALWQRLLGLDHGEPIWVAGSTHRGEEATVLDVYLRLRARVPTLTLVLAPRHPEREIG